jgi:hypothetical protein
MADISTINEGIKDKLLRGISGGGILNALGWLLLGIIIIGICGYAYFVYLDKKNYRKKLTVFEIIGNNYSPAFRDSAKSVKLGKGGFEILFLKKLKTWKIAYGGRVGRDTYYFFIGKDGYWYNGMLSSDIHSINKEGGLIPIVVTNPTMRAQYTALEKQIDSLHGDKKSFWDKYGNWVLSIAFILIIGVLAWLIFKEIAPMMSQQAALTAENVKLIDRVTELIININGRGSQGLK